VTDNVGRLAEDFLEKSSRFRSFLRNCQYEEAGKHLSEWMTQQFEKLQENFESCLILSLYEKGFRGMNVAYLTLYHISICSEEDNYGVRDPTKLMRNNAPVCWQGLAAPCLLASQTTFLGKDSWIYPGPCFPIVESPA